MKIQYTRKSQSVRGRIILIIAALASYSAGCGAAPTELPATEVLQISSATPLSLPSGTSTSTATPILSTPVPGQTLTPSPQEYFVEISRNWRVAFFLKSTNQICAMNGDGSDRTCLALSDEIISQGYTGEYLDLSPDGTKVALATDCNIYIWRIGGYVTSLRNQPGCGSFRELKWSPDGNFIAYISEELYRTCLCQSFFGDVFVDSLDGKVHRALTTDLFGWSYDPDWSPDGRNITFAHTHVIPVTDSQDYPTILPEEIFVVSSDGNNAINFTNHSATDMKPHWSPDGKRIAFLSNRRGSELFDLYMMNSNGSAVHMVAELGMEDMWPYSSYPIIWLPDNRFILHNDTLYDTRTGKSEIIRLPFDSISASWLMTSEGIGSITPHCAEEWSQLRPGIQAVVAGGPNDPPNRVRSASSANADVIAQIYPGHTVRVVEGPVCANGLVFWKVESEAIPGGMGWTAEGDGKEYWLEP
jgi:hypothetical protein